jgi:hypothetical protein
VFTLLLSILKACGQSDEFAVVQSLHSQDRLSNSNVIDSFGFIISDFKREIYN